MDIPSIYSIFKKEVKKGRQPIEVLQDLKNSSYTKAFRKYCLSLEASIANENIDALANAIKEMKQIASDINGQHSVSDKSSINIAIGPLSADVPIRLPFRRKKYVSFLHKIARESFYKR